MLKRVVVLTGLLVAASQGGAAADKLSAADCAQLSNSDARLACFDQVFDTTEPQERVAPIDPVPPGAPKPTVSEIETAPGKVTTEVLAPTPVEEAPGSVITQSPSVSRQSPAPQTTPGKRGLLGGVFDRDDQLTLNSRIKAVRERDKQRMTFMLENNEIWIQTSPRNLPFREGDDVTIKSGLMGGYVMRTSNGVSTRVRRIK